MLGIKTWQLLEQSRQADADRLEQHFGYWVDNLDMTAEHRQQAHAEITAAANQIRNGHVVVTLDGQLSPFDPVRQVLLLLALHHAVDAQEGMNPTDKDHARLVIQRFLRGVGSGRITSAEMQHALRAIGDERTLFVVEGAEQSHSTVPRKEMLESLARMESTADRARVPTEGDMAIKLGVVLAKAFYEGLQASRPRGGGDLFD